MKKKIIDQLIKMGVAPEVAESEATCFASIFEEFLAEERVPYSLEFTTYTAIRKMQDKIEKEFA